MPKVLRIINRLNLGGPTFNAALLTKHLAPEFETMLVGGMKSDWEESSEFICEQMGIEYVKLPEMEREINFSKDVVAYKKIKNLIRDFKPDIVHTHAAKAGALGRLAASSLKVPVIVHTFHGHVFHSYFNPLKTKIFLGIEKYLAKKSTAIVAISEQQKHELGIIHKVCSPEKIKIIPLGFNLDRFRENTDEKRKSFREKYFLKEDEVAIGIIGRLVPVKNHALFLRSIKYLQENSVQKFRAFIIGDGEELERLLMLASELNIEHVYFPEHQKKSVLTFTSWIKNIDWAMAGLDVVALTSFNEGTPVSLIEAQASGKPIVSTQVGGIENAVLKNETALLSESINDEKFYLNLLSLIEDKMIQKKLSKKGWEFVSTKYHYTRLTNDMKSFYHQLLRNNPDNYSAIKIQDDIIV